jgi:hypothetical protein
VFEQPEMTYEKLMEYGNMLVMEQENVKRVQLAEPKGRYTVVFSEPQRFL